MKGPMAGARLDRLLDKVGVRDPDRESRTGAGARRCAGRPGTHEAVTVVNSCVD